MKPSRELDLSAVLAKWPFAADWLENYRLLTDKTLTLYENVVRLPEGFLRDIDRTAEALAEEFDGYIADMEAFLGAETVEVKTVTLLAGHDKDGLPEGFARIDWHRGEVIAVVGATGSGKSRLLSDVEWRADGDTPTGRRVLIDGASRSEVQGDGKQRMVAQLSQNMNFVIDMSVREFLQLHAACRQREDSEGIVEQALKMADALSGERFSPETNVTDLSGGQSRALMIADCALLSDAPIVLIDEIENAGINRREALRLLTGANKIVLMATHDPVLALLADRRLIIRNGGISAVLEKNAEEEAALRAAEAMDARLMRMREALRRGERLREALFSHE